METLLQQIRRCTLCAASLPLVPKPILQASANSKILIAGQAPGQVTHEKGIPFDDKSGERLRHWLGVSRAQFYDAQLFAVIPMGFCYPGKGKSGDLPPKTLCAQTWRNSLLAQLTQVQLTIIVGKYAIEWHLSTKDPVSELTRKWQKLMTRQMLVLPHPSPRNNLWLKKNPWFEQDVIPVLRQKVQQILLT